MAYAARNEIDEQMAYELDSYIQNERRLQDAYMYIAKNLVNKMAQSKYDSAKSLKAWMHLVDRGAQEFHREFHYDVPWHVMANMATRKEVAGYIRKHFEAEAKLGNYDHLLTKVSQKKIAGKSANRSGGTQSAWNVYLNGKLIDTVFYSGKVDADDVRRGLVNHDGYDSRITVRKRANRVNRSGSTKPKWGSDRDRYHGNPNARRNRSGERPAGGDQRFRYVPFHQLNHTDQSRARGLYPYKESHLPDEAYLYPVKKDGRLASARRYMPHDTAKRLYEKR